MTFTLLFTCVGDEFAPQVVQALRASKRHDVRVIGVDVGEKALGRHFVDAFAVVPPGDHPGYVDAICAIAERYKVDLVLPKADEEALALAARRADVEVRGRKLACGSIETLRIIADKMRAYEVLAAAGIRVPAWHRATSLAEIESAVAAILDRHGGAVVKPPDERGARGVCVIRSDVRGAHAIEGGREMHMDLATFKSEFLHRFAQRLPAMVMERLVEPVHDIDILAYEGRPIRVIPRRRVDSALPNEGHLFVDAPELVDLGERLARALNLTWLYDCDVMYDAEGRPGILEVNPRPSGSLAATLAAGVPLMDDVISMAKGEALPEVAAPTGRKVVPYRAIAEARG